MNYTKKPFDLEYMKANHETQLVTRDGQNVQEWHYFESSTDSYAITVIVEGRIKLHTKGGFYMSAKKESPLDLLMLVPVEEIVRYVNVYTNDSIFYTHKTIEQAKKASAPNATHIVKITTSEGNLPQFEIVHTY